MGGKRAVEAPPAKATKAARTSLVGEGKGKSSAVVAPAADKPWTPAEQLLSEASTDLPTSCVEMLRAAIPHALSTAKDERHSFQNSVLSVIKALHVETEEKRRAAVVACEGKEASNVAENEEATSQLDAAKKDEAEKREDKIVKAAKIKEEEKAVEAAKQTLQDKRAKLDEARALATAASEKKLAYQQEVDSLWELLKSCSFERKDWRNRNKAIDTIVGCLSKAAASQSLVAALPQVLKAGAPDQRGEFAQAAIQHTEQALKGHIVKLEADIEECKRGVADQEKVVQESEASVQGAQSNLDAVMQAAIDAENAWVDADSEVSKLTRTLANFAKAQAEVSSELQSAKTSLESFRSLVTKFETLVKGAPEKDESEVQQPTEEAS